MGYPFRKFPFPARLEVIWPVIVSSLFGLGSSLCYDSVLF